MVSGHTRGVIDTGRLLLAYKQALGRGFSVSSATSLFYNADFDSETIEVMAEAIERARKSLHDRGQPPLVQQIIAGRIMSAAKTGVRDPEKLCEMALTALGNKAVFER